MRAGGLGAAVGLVGNVGYVLWQRVLLHFVQDLEVVVDVGYFVLQAQVVGRSDG